MSLSRKVISYYDNLYGYINISEKYTDIVNDPLFLRLHRISQMGMAKHVFPDAVHTRFSHSLGVYEILRKMVASQNEQYVNAFTLSEHDSDTLKMTALLHDIGHVPLSHTVERAITRYHKKTLQEPSKADSLITGAVPSLEMSESAYEQADSKLHERLGQSVLMGNTAIHEKLESHGLDTAKIAAGIIGFTQNDEGNEGQPDVFYKHSRNFMHSQLDADRLDYLLRDGAFSGVKAGAFDFDKLLSEIRYNESANYGVNDSGLRVLEQFFFARFGAYSQIVFNKKVHGLEIMAQNFYYGLLVDVLPADKAKHQIFSFDDLNAMLLEGRDSIDKFLSFDDSVFYALIEKVCDGTISCSELTKKYATYLRRGVPPKVVGYEEYFATDAEYCARNSFFDYLRTSDNLDRLALVAGVDKSNIITTDKPLTNELFKHNEDPLCIFYENEVVHESVLNSGNSILALVNQKKLYLNRIFTFEEEDQVKLKRACKELSKGFSYVGRF